MCHTVKYPASFALRTLQVLSRRLTTLQALWPTRGSEIDVSQLSVEELVSPPISLPNISFMSGDSTLPKRLPFPMHSPLDGFQEGFAVSFLQNNYNDVTLKLQNQSRAAPVELLND